MSGLQTAAYSFFHRFSAAFFSTGSQWRILLGKNLKG
jgi:hypothetical protein